MPRIQFGPFSFDAPRTWSLSSVVLSGPLEEDFGQGMLTTRAVRGFRRNLVTTMESVPPTETPDTYLERQIRTLKEAGVPRREVAPPERVTVADGHPGLLTEQIIVGQGNEQVRQMQLVVVRAGVAYTAIASHLDGPSFEAARDEFRRLLLSFQ